MSSMKPVFLFLNKSFLASVWNISFSLIVRFFPLILITPFMDGMTMFMLVSRSEVAATSQFRSPVKDLSIGMIVSIAGIRLTTFSAVISLKLMSNPVLRSFLLRVE